VKNLIFITHGWDPGVTGPPLPQWVFDMANAIEGKVSSDWYVAPYSWIDKAWTLTPDQALENAKNIGTQLGKEIGSTFQGVHLIAHSAGAGLIQAIADQLETAPSRPIVHTTFLDPYVGFDGREASWYGTGADWSDEYFTPLDQTLDWTGIPLPNCYAVDVSWLHVLATVNEGPLVIPISSHEWPYEFYTETVLGTVPSCAADYGFPRSAEGGGWNSRGAYPTNNDPIATPCGQSGVNTELLPITLGTPLNISLSPLALSEIGSTLAGGAGFILSSISGVLHGNGIHPLGGPMPQGGPSPEDSTNSPAWLAVGMSITNAVNFVQFDAGFTDTNAAQGLLSVYWNTNRVGMVDERVALPGLQMYRFMLLTTVTSGLYTLSFRLDSFDSSSSVMVTNVATGLVGMTQPITLSISVTNSTPLVQLTAATTFTYLLQSSTNLLDWTPTALLLDTNGTVQFIDSSATNSIGRFYRAVVP
jgi:hypothetical protein